MVQQVSIEKKPDRASEIGGNSSRKFIRQRSVSGPGSEGEKSLLKKNPGWLISPKVKTPVFNSCLCAFDEVLATPSINVAIFESAFDQNFKFFDAINNSKYVISIDSGVGVLGFFAVSIGYYVSKYCKLREIERESNYFYFSRLFKVCNEEVIKNKMGEIEQENADDPISFEHLLTSAYFYPPDILKVIGWKRRFFASGKKRKQLKSLDTFLTKNSEKITLSNLHGKITKKVCFLLNGEAKLNIFQTKKHNNNWTIGLADNYAIKFFEHIEALINKNSDDIIAENRKKTQNFFSSIFSALGQASFIYWILVFTACFFPMFPVVTSAAISIIPLGITLLGFLPYLLFYEIKKAHKIYHSKKNITKNDIEKRHKQMLEKKLLELNKQKIFFDFLKEEVNSTVTLGNSPLIKDLHEVIKKRRFSKYHAICMGFLDGCFLPLFVGWLLLDATKVILTYALCPPMVAFTSFTPIGLITTAIIAGVILLISISNGIYLAYKANKTHQIKFEDLEIKIEALKNELPNKRILNKSLRDYDRILRRFSDEQPIWTEVKKVLNRGLVIIKRLGTGSLVFRLIIWGPITAIVAASTAVIPAFLSIILIVGTVIGALVIASWYLYAYNLESKVGQAGRIIEHLVQTEQLDCINKDLQNKLIEESLDVEKINGNEVAYEKTEIVSEKLTKSHEKDSQFSGSKLSQEDSIAGKNDHPDKVNIVTTQVKVDMQRNNSNSNLPGLFKYIQNIEKSDQNMDVCLTSHST